MRRSRDTDRTSAAGGFGRGFSAIEILICIVIMAFAVVPILTMVTQGGKKASLTEWHVLAQMRANLILEMLVAQGYRDLRDLAKASGGTLTSPLKEDDPVIPPALRERSKVFQDMVLFEEVTGKEGLGIISVTVTWKLKDSISDKRPHTFTTERIVCDTKGSLEANYPLRQRGP